MIHTIAGRNYKMGYTTGSCAAAAAKAAVSMLVTKEKIKQISIDTPAGIPLVLEVKKGEIGNESTQCCIVKDGGDDADSTTGMEIFAKAQYSKEKGIQIKAGKGIGIVTKKGLQVKPGEPAINKVPMMMILQEVSKIKENGICITIFAPEGEERAKKTFNARLGIIGGISIIGTTGIVKPMSEDAWKEAILLELKMKKEQGYRAVCLVFGNYGEDFCVHKLKMKKEVIVIMSNFVGYVLESASRIGFETILIVGHIGKLVKVAGGIFHTHSRIADGRMETICTFAALEGASVEVIEKIYHCITTEAAEKVIEENNLKGIYEKIVQKAEEKCRQYIQCEKKIGCILFNNQNEILSKSKNADGIMTTLRNEVYEQ